jgi:hypothetical protein
MDLPGAIVVLQVLVKKAQFYHALAARSAGGL